MLIEDVAKPHYWFSGVISCNGSVDVSYVGTFLNQQDGAMLAQFSFEEVVGPFFASALTVI